MRRIIVISTGLTAALTASVMLVLAATQGEGSSPTTPTGTMIGGMLAEGLDRTAVRELLGEAEGDLPEQLTVTLGRRTATVTDADLGIDLDVDATVHRVFSQKRPARNIAPVLRIDTEVLDRSTARLEAVAEVAPFEGDLHYARSSLHITAPTAGQQVDAAAIKAGLLAHALQLPLPTKLSVKVRQVPSRTTMADLAPVLASGRTLLARPLTLEAASRRVTVRPAALGPELTVVRLDSTTGQQPALGLRRSASSLAARLADQLTTPAVEPVLSAPTPAAMLREKGNVSWKPVRVPIALSAVGQPGRRVDQQSVLRALSSVVRDGAGTPQVLPTQPVLPRSSDAAARQVDAVLGTFTTSFACCQPRVRNISLMARTIDGTLIGPGQTFSLNGIVGPRTRKKGYLEAPYILDGELSTDVGGGVSQVATTTLNAAYFAGLRIDRHKAHSFYISRYPPGREATVNYPGIDLRWTNTTAWPVLVRARALTNSVTVTIYGHDDGRSIRSTTGARKPVKGKAFRITVTRVTTVPGRPPSSNSMTTTYNNPPADD